MPVILAQGDSLMVGMQPYLHVQVDARVGRTLQEGARLLARRNIQGKIVFVSLGTNDFTRSRQYASVRIKALKRKVGSGCLVWGLTTNALKVNEVLRASKGKHLKLVKPVRPVYGVHPDANGYRKLARRFRKVSKKC